MLLKKLHFALDKQTIYKVERPGKDSWKQNPYTIGLITYYLKSWI